MKRVVIIGGGFLGAKAARLLENDFDVTLIDTKDYYEFTPGILRTIVEPEHMNNIQVKHKDYLRKAKVIRGEATKITKREVEVGDRSFPFDYCILATGSRYETPIKQANVVLSTRASVLKEEHAAVKKAKNIVIVGGGLVGVELAAELAQKWANKKVTIVHAHDSLMERQNDKARNYANAFLSRRGVHIVFNERMKTVNEHHITTESGKKYRADMIFLCLGIKPNSELLRATFPEGVDNHGYVKVNEFLQMTSHPNIFVGGDVAAINEEKTAQNAEMEASVIVGNIRNLEENNPLQKYNPAPRIMVISLGKYAGILTYKNYTLTGVIPAILKTLVEWKTMVKYGR